MLRHCGCISIRYAVQKLIINDSAACIMVLFNIAISSLVVTHWKSRSLVCVDQAPFSRSFILSLPTSTLRWKRPLWAQSQILTCPLEYCALCGCRVLAQVPKSVCATRLNMTLHDVVFGLDKKDCHVELLTCI